MIILKLFRHRPRRTVGFDRTCGVTNSKCPLRWSKCPLKVYQVVMLNFMIWYFQNCPCDCSKIGEPRTIFFLRTSADKDWDLFTACSVYSTALYHPTWTVKVKFVQTPFESYSYSPLRPFEEWKVLYSVPPSDTLVTIVMQLLQTSTWFRHRRTLGFDRADCAFGAIKSNCPSSSKSSRSL